MPLSSNPHFGKGGIGVSGTGPGTLAGAVKELQGLTVSLLAGANANTKIDLAAIRTEDTIVGALNNNAGTITDLLSTMSIVDLRATGTITLASCAAADTVTVNGKVYTAVAGTAADYIKFSIDGNDTADAAALAAAINARENAPASNASVVATSALGVVTITAKTEGTGGNAITLLSSNGTRAAVTGSGTLTSGSGTGGVKSTSASNQIILFWYKKNA